MTTRRLVVSLAASAGVLTLAGALAVRAFPLHAQERQTTSGAPVEIVKGGDHLLHGGVPEYPRRAIEAKVEGDVLLDVAVDDRGEVSDARVLSGPDELRKVALEAVLDWHYAPAFVRSSSTQATLRFHLPPPNAEFQGVNYAFANKEEQENHELTPAQQTEREIMKLDRALQDPNVREGDRDELKAKLANATDRMAKLRAELDAMSEGERAVRYKIVRDGRDMRVGSNAPLRLAGVRTERVSEEAVKQVLQTAGVSIGDALTEDTLKRLRASAASIDEHIQVEMTEDAKGQATLVLIAR